MSQRKAIHPRKAINRRHSEGQIDTPSKKSQGSSPGICEICQACQRNAPANVPTSNGAQTQSRKVEKESCSPPAAFLAFSRVLILHSAGFASGCFSVVAGACFRQT